ncbi:alpha/beta hydrolase [Nonomuraea roseoviolacea]|uniref:Enterochelin esterase family protein n=1 Tax=Nonomuraea roseoviolacea subsp. carminata TaxID=160689 RepID=A0ABT1KCR5_9ACTN|nr:alpha/beta hydrolase-fold protein [Nonomuraea roseoviolacea]MCP2351745.1 enterochelin esterase family protein [Nonomuraea roseoviolacea subsp. carminata]
MGDDVLSPSIRALFESDDPAGSEARLWTGLRSDGTPLIETCPDDPGTRLVTFLWKADRPVEQVRVNETVSGLPPDRRCLTPVPGTATWFLTWRIRADVRTTYSFEVVGASGTERVPDPYARVREPHDFAALTAHGAPPPESVLVCPDAEPLSWAERRPGVPRGTVSEEAYDDGRKMWTYLPAGHDGAGAPLGVLVVLDGHAGHSASTVLDNLHAEGLIPPTAALFVQQGDRGEELACNPEWSRHLAEDLLPWARRRHPLTEDPAATVITGRSLGGLCAAYTGLKHPDVFGGVLMLSGSAWWDPDTLRAYLRPAGPAAQAAAAVVGARSRTPALIDEFRRADPVPIRIHQEVGAFETGPPPATPGQIHASRHLRDVLALKGYDHRYHEFAGGHDETWWRSRLGDGLIWLRGDGADA